MVYSCIKEIEEMKNQVYKDFKIVFHKAGGMVIYYPCRKQVLSAYTQKSLDQIQISSGLDPLSLAHRQIDGATE